MSRSPLYRPRCKGSVTVRVTGTKPPTTFNRSCQRDAAEGSDYCWQHADQEHH